MRKKELVFLIGNIPACFGLLFLFGFLLSVSPDNGAWIWGGFVGVIVLFFVSTLLVNVLVLRALKVCNAAMVFLSVLQVLMFYVYIWHWLETTSFK